MGFEVIWVKVRADLTDFNRKMAGMKASMQKVGQSMKSAGMQMTLGLTAPIALFGAATLRAAGNFEAGMNRVQAVTDATKTEFKKLEDQAKKLGATTQFSASEAADAMGFLGMAGLRANEILGAMPDTLNLAAAAQLDMGRAADIVTNVVKGMKVPIEDLPQAVDILTKAFTSSNTDLLQLGQAMSKVGAGAANMGQDLAGTTAALGVLGNAGIQAGVAGRGFRRVLIELAKKSKDLGINVRDSSGAFIPFVDQLEQLEKVGFTGADAMLEFSANAGTALSTLLNEGSGKLRTFTELLDNAGGTAERIAKVQMEGLNGALKKLKSAFEAFQLALADSGLLKWITDFTSGLADFFREMAKTNPELLRMGIAIAAVVAVIGPMALIMGTLITAAGAMLGPIALVVAGLSALAAIGVTSAIENSKLSNSLTREQLELNNLVGAITAANNTEESRLRLIEEMQSKYPNFLKNIEAEKISNEQLKTALEEVNEQYKLRITEQLKTEAISGLTQNLVNTQMRELKLIKEINEAKARGDDISKSNATTGALGIDNVTFSYTKLVGALELNRKKQGELKDEISETISAYDELLAAAGKVSGSEVGSVGGTSPPTQPSGGAPASDPTDFLLAEAETSLRIVQLEQQRNGIRNDFLGMIRNSVAIQKEELDLINQKIAAAESANESDPNNPEILAKIADLNAEKIRLELKFSADINKIKEENRALNKEMTDAEWEAFLVRHQQRIDKETEMTERLDDEAQKRIKTANAVSNAVSLAMVKMSNSITRGLAQSESGFQRFAGVMIGVVTRLIAMLLATAISNAIVSGSQTGMSKGPLAAYATPAFIATAVGGVVSAFAAIPAFAQGGIVSAPTLAMVGDNRNARHDPEVISPLSKLKGMIGGGGSQELFSVVRGEDIYLANKEYMRKLDNTN